LTTKDMSIALDDLKTNFSSQIGDPQTTVAGQVLPLLENINQIELATYQDLTAYINDSTKRAAQQQQAQQQQQFNQLKIEATHQAVYLLSTFAGLVDPQLGHTMEVVGNVAIQVNTAFSNYDVAA